MTPALHKNNLARNLLAAFLVCSWIVIVGTVVVFTVDAWDNTTPGRFYWAALAFILVVVSIGVSWAWLDGEFS